MFMEPKPSSPNEALVNAIASEKYGEGNDAFSLKVWPVGQRILALNHEDKRDWQLLPLCG